MKNKISVAEKFRGRRFEDIIDAPEHEEILIEKDSAYLKAFSGGAGGKRRGSLRTLFTLYRGNYGRLLFGLFCKILDCLPSLYFSVATANVINILTYRLGEPSAVSEIVLNLAIVVIGCAVFNPPLDALFVRNNSIAIRSVEANLRSSIIRKLHMLSISYYKRIHSGRLQSKIMRDVEAVSQLSHSLLASVSEIIITFLFSVVVTALKDPRILLLYLVMAPISVSITQAFRKRLRASNSTYRHEMENTSASVMEAMELIPVTKAHGVENIQVEKIDRRFEQVAVDGYKLDRENAFFSRMIWLTGVLMRVTGLAVTAFLAWKKVILIGDVVLYTTYLSTIVGDINAILGFIPIFTKGMESVNSVGDILLAEDIEDNESKFKPPRLRGDVRFEDVSFQYDDGNRPVLKHFDLDVKAGETIALVGASGCGKTTAVNLIIGFGRVVDGQVLIDGMNINTFDLHAYRAQLAVVPQTPILFSGTIRDNITYGTPHLSDEAVMTAIEQANLSEFVQSLPEGLDTMVGEHGGNLSGGQRQRIAIARALIRNPSIVILDEATSALDTVSERKIQTAIDNVAHGRTTFIVAHRLSTIRNADRIVVIVDGHPIESGTYEELMAMKGEFYKLQTM